MQTVIKSVDIEWVGSGAKKYGKATVKHVGDKGEKTQYLVSFKNPDVFKKVQEMVGQTVEVESKKDGDFWQWVSIQSAQNAQPGGTSSGVSTAGTTRVSGSNYETKEERAARQVLIVKQNGLTNAVATLTVGAKTPPKKDEVIALAQQYVDWVLDTAPPKVSNISDMDDDIPF